MVLFLLLVIIWAEFFYNPYREKYFVDVLGYRVDRCQFLDMRVVDDRPVLVMYEKRKVI